MLRHRCHPWRRSLGLAPILALVLGCGEGERAWEPGCDRDLERLAAASASPPAADFIDWASLRNPIFALEDRPIKDQAVLTREGWFYVFPGMVRTRDFRHYEPLEATHLGQPSSPDVRLQGDVYVMTYQVAADEPGATTLRFATSPDLEHWSEPRELAPEIVDPGLRNLDAALARVGDRYFLGWKRVQSFVVTRSQGTRLDGPWLDPVPGDGRLRFGPSANSHDWAENYQFVEIDGRWHMVATARAPGIPFTRHVYTGSHEPYLYSMDGSGDALEDWTRWICKRQLQVPREDWNRAMHANSAFLADWRKHDGHFYLFYAGSEDHEKFDRRGHGKIGVVRSRDLVHWVLPGETGE